MFKIIAWAIWIQLIITVLFITLLKLPYRLTMSEAQMYIQAVSSYGKTNNHRSTYAIGTVEGWDKPVHLSIAGLMGKSNKFGNEQEFMDQFVNTGVPLDVFVGRMWMVSHDVAYVDMKDGSQPGYSIIQWVIFDVVLISICILMYVFLTKPKKNQH
jgi:hypothetical protein